MTDADMASDAAEPPTERPAAWPDFWPDCGWRHLRLTDAGTLAPTAAWWGHWLSRPELALVPESCPDEVALHRALQADPLRAVPEAELAALADAEVAQNYRWWLALRDGAQAAGTLEAYYLGLFRADAISLPPLFIDLIVQALVRQLLDAEGDALQARAAEMLFRPQRVSLQNGRVLAGDSATLDALSDGAGFGALGRLLAEAKVPLRTAQLAVLTDDNAPEFWADAARSPTRHRHLLDLTPPGPKTLATGVQVPLTLARSGLAALARVLTRWLAHLLGVGVSLTPLARLDDVQGAWLLGLDTESTALLNELVRGETPEPERLARLIGLFRLDFHHPAEQQATQAGRPVYLGLAMREDGSLRLKPQNLLRNLPLAKLTH